MAGYVIKVGYNIMDTIREDIAMGGYCIWNRLQGT